MKKRGYRSRILVTGGSGFIGKNLIPQLEDKYDILNWDLEDENNIFNDNFETWIKNRDVVIHLAAKTSVNKSFDEPDKHYVVNTLGTARVAYLCWKYKIKLIYPSTGAVYHRELSPYAESKAIAEDLVRGMGGNATILRFFNVYGPDMNKNSGSIMYNFLTDPEITVYGDGEQKRDFIHVRDICSILEDAIKAKYDGKLVECGTGQSYTINYVAGLFAHFRKKKIKYAPPKREVKWSIANTAALKALYKKPLTTNLERDIEEMVND